MRPKDPIRAAPINPKTKIQRRWSIGGGDQRNEASRTPAPTIKARTIEAPIIANESSQPAKGGSWIKIRLPIIFEDSIEEELFPKAFCSIVIITRPGTRKCR